MAYEHTNSKRQKYYLHSKNVKLKGSGKTQTIYYFARKAGSGSINSLPEGYKVIESKRTGLPILKKK